MVIFPLVAFLIIVGMQVWYIVGLALDKELSTLQCIVLGAVLLLIASGASGLLHMPGVVFFLLLFLPIISLKIIQGLEEKHGLKMEEEQRRQEIRDWEYTVQKEPEFAGAYIFLGDLHLRLGERDKALAYYRKALSLRPEDPKVMNQIYFIEHKMELLPKLTKDDRDIVKAELKRTPLVAAVVTAALGLIALLFHYLQIPPPIAGSIIFMLIPAGFLICWIMKL
jgi:tetratricopeptide (TPR) repeat protein